VRPSATPDQACTSFDCILRPAVWHEPRFQPLTSCPCFGSNFLLGTTARDAAIEHPPALGALRLVCRPFCAAVSCGMRHLQPMGMYPRHLPQYLASFPAALSLDLCDIAHCVDSSDDSIDCWRAAQQLCNEVQRLPKTCPRLTTLHLRSPTRCGSPSVKATATG